MKIKADFVTNSSSSAFVVVWPHLITEEADVSKYIKRAEFIPIITKDALGQKGQEADPSNKIAIHSLTENLDSGHIDGIDDWDYDRKFCKNHNISEDELNDNIMWRRQMWDEQSKIKKEQCTVLALEFLKKHEGNFLYYFEYGDESGGIFANLEHENDWGGLPFMRISHH